MWEARCRLTPVYKKWRCACNMQTRGEGRSTLVAKNVRECVSGIILAQNLLFQAEARSQVPVRTLLLKGTEKTISMDNAVVQNYQPKLWSSYLPICVCVKYVPRVFLPWVDLNPRERIEPPPQAFHKKIGLMEKNVYVDCGSYYCAYPYFTSTNNPEAYPLDHTCKYTCHHIQIWCR